MISVIVPVYNVELYLGKCLDSLLAETFTDLEILVIDDGSTDRSGGICDRYSESDKRVRVFHTENRGLSAARNLGLDHARGEYIGFVDSDDWIDPEMYALLLNKAEETGADIVECGVFRESVHESREICVNQTLLSGIPAVETLIFGGIKAQVWNKLWKRTLFDEIRFPEGRCFEDVATTYKLILNANIVGIPQSCYHYLQRDSSISQNHSSKSLVDYWSAHRERYEDLKDMVGREARDELLKYCAYSVARTWAWCIHNGDNTEYTDEMTAFVRKMFPVFGDKAWPMQLRVSIFLARNNKRLSLAAAYYFNQLYRRIKPKHYE